MLKLTPQKLEEIFAGLPQDVKDAIFSVDSSKVIQEIGEKKNMTVDKIGELADEVGLVMFGLTHPRDFIVNLSKRLEIDREKAKEIAEEINNRLFSKIRESLKQVHGLSSKKEEPEIKGPLAMNRFPDIKAPEKKPIDIQPISQGFSDIKREIDNKKINEVFGAQEEESSGRIDIDEIAPEKASLEEEINGIKEISALREQEELKEETYKVPEVAVDGQVIKKDLLKEIETEEYNKPIEKPLESKLQGPFSAKTGEIFRMPTEETAHTVNEEKGNKVSLVGSKEGEINTGQAPVDPYREPTD